MKEFHLILIFLIHQFIHQMIHQFIDQFIHYYLISYNKSFYIYNNICFPIHKAIILILFLLFQDISSNIFELIYQEL